MCGICGFNGLPDGQRLKKMADSLKHRGPDDEGFYLGENINLGMRRLSIIDLVTGRQPIANENQTIHVVFNGEIYNFLELKKELKKKGHRFSTQSDTETIVHLYEEHGLDFPNKLNGMFAIALWDSRKKQLVLVRDRLGVKPLYYFLKGERLVFGSEIKAILVSRFYNREIEFESLHHFLSLKHTPAPKTIFKDIFNLLPGELLVFKEGKIKKHKYWDLVFRKNTSLGEKEVEEKILNILADAVKLRMRSDVPIGAYLSGGVDSSSVVALMTKFTNQPINTFCLGYQDNFENKLADFQSARRVARLYRTNHHEYIMFHKEVPEQIERVIEAFDEPFGGVISTFFISQLIKKHVKVALAGDGADELFGSYLSHRLARAAADYFTNKEIGLNQKDRETFFKVIEKESGNWRAKLSVFSEEEKSNLYRPWLKLKMKKFSTVNLWKSYFGKTTTDDYLNQMLEAEFKTIFPDQVLAFADRLSMSHSIELRSPFLDYRLAELAASIPGDLKIKNGVVKSVLKKAVGDLLPKEIIERPKEGFVLPINQWLLGSLEKYVKSSLSPHRLAKHGFFDAALVKDLVKCYYSHRQVENSNKIWNLIIFQLWWEKYF